MFELSVQQQYFDAIITGQKTIEGRLAKDKYRLLPIGSQILFRNNDHSQDVTKKVVSLKIYKTFRDAFRYEDYKNAVPDANNLEEAVAVYEKFFSESEQLRYGVIFISIV